MTTRLAVCAHGVSGTHTNSLLYTSGGGGGVEVPEQAESGQKVVAGQWAATMHRVYKDEVKLN